jgi:hypothetical protein
MCSASNITIDEGTVKDLRWFTQCARSVNGTVRFLKSVHPQTEIFVDASLTALGGSWAIGYIPFLFIGGQGGLLPTGRPSTSSWH